LTKRYEYIERSQVRFEWPIPQKVVLAREDVLLVLFSLKEGVTYNPFERSPTLFVDFLSLPLTPQSIVEFIKQWGTLRVVWPIQNPEDKIYLLTFCDGRPCETISARLDDFNEAMVETLPPMSALYALSKTGIAEEDTNYLRRADSLYFWVQEIWNMAMTFQAWRIVEERDIEWLRRVALIRRPKDAGYNKVFDVHFVFTNLPREVVLTFQDAETLYQKAAKGTSQDIASLRSYLPNGAPLLVTMTKDPLPLMVEGDNLEDALFATLLDWVSLKVSHHLKGGVYPIVQSEEGRLAAYLKPKDLLSAMWLQFYFVLVGEKRIKRCSICGLWEDVTDKTKAWSAHAECAQRERFRKYYHEKLKRVRELYREGKSPEEIASLLGKDVEWVRKRLEKIIGSSRR